ncbi:cell surface protein [Sporosarcina sp. FSL K6-1522]|uniref:cell surface protein n=1 Tax=Sporosarcina sp. FSL K6-1522 TaxID=2921554 RepID=UPI00315A14F2
MGILVAFSETAYTIATANSTNQDQEDFDEDQDGSSQDEEDLDENQDGSSQDEEDLDENQDGSSQDEEDLDENQDGSSQDEEDLDENQDGSSQDEEDFDGDQDGSSQDQEDEEQVSSCDNQNGLNDGQVDFIQDQDQEEPCEDQIKSLPLLLGVPLSTLQYPGVNVINEALGVGKSIPGKYAFQFRLSDRVSYEAYGYSTSYSNRYRYRKGTGNPSKSAYVLVRNAGIYNDSWIDLRINILQVDMNNLDIYVPTTKSSAAEQANFLRIDSSSPIGSSSKVSMEFLKAGTNEKVNITGMWNFKRLNNYKSIDLKPDNFLTSLFVYDTTKINYMDNIDGTVNFVGTVIGEKKDTNMTILFEDIDEFPITINSEKGLGYLKYERDPISKIELPAPDIIGEVTIDDSRELRYHIYQTIPAQSMAAFNPRLVIIESEVNPHFTIKSVDIKGLNGENYNSFFTVSQTGNKISLVANNPVAPDFQDKVFDIKILGSLKTNSDYLKLYKNGYLEVPVSARVFSDTSAIGLLSEPTNARVLYKGKPTGYPVPQTVRKGTDLTKMDISKFISNLSVDTNAAVDLPIRVVGLENIPNTAIIGDYMVTVVIETAQKVQARIQVPIYVRNEESLKLIDIPKIISFSTIKVPNKRKYYNRTFMEGSVAVVDTRTNKNKWYVYVKVLTPLTSPNNKELTGTLVYTHSNGRSVRLNSSLYEVLSETALDDKPVKMDWKANEGIRLYLEPGPNIEKNQKYQGELEWTLTDAPI